MKMIVHLVIEVYEGLIDNVEVFTQKKKADERLATVLGCGDDWNESSIYKRTVKR